MARLVTEIFEKEGRQVWLDQRALDRTANPEHVVRTISKVFPCISQVIILVAPGDWQRFTDLEDIHRWEWELALRSGQYAPRTAERK